MRIVPLAVKNYFAYGIPVEQTIKENRDIFNFCMQLKTNSTSTPLYRHLVDGEIVNDKLGRMTRYLIVNKGKDSGILLKKFEDGRITGVNVGYSVKIFNKVQYLNWDDYKLDYQFYITEANKLINPLVMKELDLFA